MIAEPPNMAQIRQDLQHVVFKQASQQVSNGYSRAVFGQLARCHTAAQGVHQYRCGQEGCFHNSYQYHSCGNRHCPHCGGSKRAQWIDDKMAELLPTSYFHMVFTLPHELNGLIMGHRKALYTLLFEAASQAILTLSQDPKWLGATPGIIGILHSWGQDLSFHPHVHCIVSGGGVNGQSWVKEKRANHRFMFPEAVLRKVYKAIFMKGFNKLVKQGTLKIEDEAQLKHTIKTISGKPWNVKAKAPFGGPAQVLEYLGRYTHKVAITAHRILSIDPVKKLISFKYKDYHARGTKDQNKEMTLPIAEFIRRFEQHILPKGYVKIRHFGYLKNHNRTARLKAIFAQMALPAPPPKVKTPIRQRILEQTGRDIALCPSCKTGTLELVATYRFKAMKIEINSSQSTHVLAPP